MKCLLCPYIQKELISRLNQVIEIYDEIPSLYFIITEVLSNCYCDKTGWKLYGGRCDGFEMITEEDYTEFLIKNGYGEQIEGLEEEKFPITDETSIDPLNDIKETKIQRKRNRDKKYKKQLRKIWKEAVQTQFKNLDIGNSHLTPKTKEFTLKADLQLIYWVIIIRMPILQAELKPPQKRILNISTKQ